LPAPRKIPLPLSNTKLIATLSILLFDILNPAPITPFVLPSPFRIIDNIIPPPSAADLLQLVLYYLGDLSLWGNADPSIFVF
jgi:hypothetical protein